MDKQRFLIKIDDGNDDNAYKEAIHYACKLFHENPELKYCVLLVATKHNIGWFERLFNNNTIIKRLFDKGAILIKDCKVIFKLETIKTFDEFKFGQQPLTVITCGLDSDDVILVDKFNSVKNIIAIPWTLKGLNKWIRTWGPFEIRQKQQVIDVFPEPSCVVKEALQNLNKLINLSILHPNDEELIKTYLLALYTHEPLSISNTDIISAYLLKTLNWPIDYIQTVEKLIIKLNNGKYFKGGDRSNLKKVYERFKEQCNE